MPGADEGEFANPASATHCRAGARARASRGARDRWRRSSARSRRRSFLPRAATESNNLAILGVARAHAGRGRHIVSFAHRAPRRARSLPAGSKRKASRSRYLTPDRAGRIGPRCCAAALRADTALVSSHAREQRDRRGGRHRSVRRAVRRRAAFRCTADAAQSVGKLAIDVRTLPLIS